MRSGPRSRDTGGSFFNAATRSEPDAASRASPRFFGRRKGRSLRAGRAELFERLLPRVALNLLGPPPPELAGLFSDTVADVRLEIGFGAGELLLAEAERNPRTGFLGCEPFLNGMAAVLAAIEERGSRNIRLHHGDAAPLLDWLPRACLAGIDLVYPDPWPKRRHWKRRFVQPGTVAAMARLLRSGAALRFVSDSPDYVDWTLLHFLRSPDFAWTAERADDWRRPWPGFTASRYHAKALREGRAASFLVFRRR
jgi:tRNA (guanine-N7-)-methyltransferase